MTELPNLASIPVPRKSNLIRFFADIICLSAQVMAQVAEATKLNVQQNEKSLNPKPPFRVVDVATFGALRCDCERQ
jgi:hypothetical protein